MLFRRFGIVTLSFMLMGMLLAQAVETHHRNANSVSVENRMQQWEKFYQKRACEANQEVCLNNTPKAHAA